MVIKEPTKRTSRAKQTPWWHYSPPMGNCKPQA